MPSVTEFVEYKPWKACRILVVVNEDGRTPVLEYFHEIKKTHPDEYKKIVLTLKKAVAHGPRNIHDPGMCKLVGDVGEFKARKKLLRIFWFFADSKKIGSLLVDTIVLTHAARPDKGPQQSKEIAKAEKMLAEYLISPFPEI